jgi:hypothetical protein
MDSQNLFRTGTIANPISHQVRFFFPCDTVLFPSEYVNPSLAVRYLSHQVRCFFPCGTVLFPSEYCWCLCRDLSSQSRGKPITKIMFHTPVHTRGNLILGKRPWRKACSYYNTLSVKRGCGHTCRAEPQTSARPNRLFSRRAGLWGSRILLTACCF